MRSSYLGDVGKGAHRQGNRACKDLEGRGELQSHLDVCERKARNRLTEEGGVRGLHLVFRHQEYAEGSQG